MLEMDQVEHDCTPTPLLDQKHCGGTPSAISIDSLSDYVIISGNPPSHVGSGSKQGHVVHREPKDT